MEEKKERMLSAVRFWTIPNGMEEIHDEDYTDLTDLVFKKDEKIYGFITEFDRDEKMLKSKSKTARDFCDYIYIVTDDNAKRKYIQDNTVKGTGILCYGNSFGLGYIYQVLREAELIK